MKASVIKGVMAIMIAIASIFWIPTESFAQGGLPSIGTCNNYTIGATGYYPIYVNNGGMFVNVQWGYKTTGTVSAITTQLYGGYDTPAVTTLGTVETATPGAVFAQGASLTNTTSADGGGQSGSYPYWYINTSTLTTTGGTQVVYVCVSNQVTKQALLSTLPVSQGGTGLATLTTSAIYKGAGTSAPLVSSATDDGTTFAINTNKFSVTEASGNTVAAGTFSATLGVVPIAGSGAATGSTFFADTGSPAAGSTGTNTTGIANQLWYTQMYIPHNVTITNIAFLCGGTCTTDKAAIGIFSTAGTLLACTATTAGGGTLLSGANTFQNYTLSASCPNGATTLPIIGPTHIIVGVVTNGTTAGSIQTYPLANGPVCAVAGSQGTLATFTPAVTKTAASCPYIVVN